MNTVFVVGIFMQSKKQGEDITHFVVFDKFENAITFVKAQVAKDIDAGYVIDKETTEDNNKNGLYKTVDAVGDWSHIYFISEETVNKNADTVDMD